MNEEVKLLKKVADYFYKAQKQVHIKFRKGYWKRGYIKEIFNDYFILLENFDGEMPVFFLEILSIETYKTNLKIIKDEVKDVRRN